MPFLGDPRLDVHVYTYQVATYMYMQAHLNRNLNYPSFVFAIKALPSPAEWVWLCLYMGVLRTLASHCKRR